MERISLDRLQSMLDYANARAVEEDCTRRLDNRALVLKLDNARRISITRCWGGDLN